MDPGARARPLVSEVMRAFKPALFALLGLLVLTLVYAAAQWWITDRTDRLIEADRTREASSNAVHREASAVRGRLLTGDPAAARTARSIRDDAASVDRLLLHRVAGDARLGDLVLDAWTARNAWRTEWADPALAAEDPATLATDTSFLTAGDALLEDYRTVDAVIADRLDQSIDIWEQRSHALVIAIATAALVIAGAGLVGSWRHARRVRRDIDAPLHDMLSVIRRVRGGDLSAALDVTGPAELRDIATELATTTRSLADERTRADRRELELSRLADVAGRVLDFAQDFSATLDADRIVATIAKGALPISHMQESFVWLVEHPDDEIVLAHAARHDGVAPSVGSHRRRMGETLPGRAAQLGRGLYERGGEVSARRPAEVDEVDGVALPMVAGGSTVGVLELRADAPHRLDVTTLELLEKVSSQAGIAIEAARMHGRTRELIRRDDLTGLYNRRQLDADLSAELARFRRYQTPCTFVLLDLDHFKDVNDTLGHQAGDEFLAAFARVLSDTVRATDTAYRYGGEEFGVILRECDADDAQRFLERLRARNAELAGLAGDGRTVTFSGGVCQAADMLDESEFVLRAADRALYDAKRRGRDRWAVAGETVVTLEEPEVAV